MANKHVIVRNTDGEEINPSTEENTILLRKILKVLESNATIDASQRQRITIDAVGVTTGAVSTACNGTVPVSGTVSATISALVASNANTGNVCMQFGPQGTTAAIGGIDSRFFMMDTARIAYNSGIRAGLGWDDFS